MRDASSPQSNLQHRRLLALGALAVVGCAAVLVIIGALLAAQSGGLAIAEVATPADQMLHTLEVDPATPPRPPLSVQRLAAASVMFAGASALEQRASFETETQPAAASDDPASHIASADRPAPDTAESASPAFSWGVQQSTCPNPSSQLLTETIESDITAAPIVVHVLLPPCYDPERYEYPTLYLIHGTAYEQGGWFVHGIVELTELQMGLGVLPPFIIVMPGADMRAGEASRYSWTNGGPKSYEAFFVNELVPLVEERFSTWRASEGRAIGGISRGGYWSVEIGFAHPELFNTIGGHSPSVHSLLVGVPPGFTMLYWADSIEALRQKRIWIDAGTRDWARVDAQKLADDLSAQDIPFQLSFGDGGHEDDYWTSRLAEYLAFYSAGWPLQPRPRATP